MIKSYAVSFKIVKIISAIYVPQPCVKEIFFKVIIHGFFWVYNGPFSLLMEKRKLVNQHNVKQLFKQSWISLLFPLILLLSHFFPHCWCPWAPETNLSNVPSLPHGLSVSLLCTCPGCFLLSFVPSLDWVYIRLGQEIIYTENNEHWSSHLAPKCLPQWNNLIFDVRKPNSHTKNNIKLCFYGTISSAIWICSLSQTFKLKSHQGFTALNSIYFSEKRITL